MVSGGGASALSADTGDAESEDRRRPFATAGVHPSPRVETDSISALLSHVRWGRCASVVPQSWLLSLGVPDGTHVLRFTDGDAASAIGLIWLEHDPQPLLTTALLDVARSLELQPIIDSVLASITDEAPTHLPR